MLFYPARNLVLRLAACAALLLLAASFAPQAWPRQSVMFQRHEIDQWRTNRIIVKWRTTGVAAVQMDSIAQRAARLSSVNGIHLTPARNLYGRTDVMLLDYTPARPQMQQILSLLNADPAVEYAEPDGYRFLQQFPASLQNDPRFVAGSDSFGSWVGQWYLQPSSSTTPAAISATTAWTTSLGAGVVVAVLDTGVIEDHPDLASNLQLPGYDFVSCDQGNSASTVTTTLGATQGVDLCSASGSAATYYAANDGKDWHDDASDPGDFIDATDVQTAFFISNSCTTEEPSSWHGTKIAGLIGAVADGNIGTVGVAPSTKVLPVRVVGTCLGARVSDIAAAILWAAGQPVTVSTGSIQSSPAATIINISLGSPSACSATEQDAINTVTDAGVLVVAAAGNEGGAMDAPANCTSVLSVVGLNHTGDKAPFSSLSSESVAASIAAPAGDCDNAAVTQPCLYDIETTSDAGLTSPSPTPGFYTYALLDQSYLKDDSNSNDGNSENEANTGTSFAAPMVAGVAALMRAANSSLNPSQITARLQSSALAFPTSSPGSSPKPGQCALASSGAASDGNFSEPATPVECLCTTQTCGAGMLNAANAVTAALAAFVQIVPSHTSGVPGQKISLDGSGSTAKVGNTIASYQWVTVPAISDQLINANEATATLVVPSFRSIGVMLTITDDKGNQTSGSITIDSTFGGKAGGAFGPGWLLALGLLAAWSVTRRRGAFWN
jgi:serine protease